MCPREVLCCFPQATRPFSAPTCAVCGFPWSGWHRCPIHQCSVELLESFELLPLAGIQAPTVEYVSAFNDLPTEGHWCPPA